MGAYAYGFKSQPDQLKNNERDRLESISSARDHFLQFHVERVDVLTLEERLDNSRTNSLHKETPGCRCSLGGVDRKGSYTEIQELNRPETEYFTYPYI